VVSQLQPNDEDALPLLTIDFIKATLCLKDSQGNPGDTFYR